MLAVPHMGKDAKRKKVLVTEPQEGDVFLMYWPAVGRFAHAGIVVHVADRHQRPDDSMWYECVTIEGNTNEEGSREGTVGRMCDRWIATGGPSLTYMMGRGDS